MKVAVEEFGKALGLSPQGAGIVGTIFGMLLIFLGLTLLTMFVASIRRRAGEGGTHRLVPTLAEEMLDADLGTLYRRSLRLDARLFNARHASPAEPTEAFEEVGEQPRVDIQRVGDTGSALGRALRKLLLRIQAKRFARHSEKERPAQKNEPPFGEARLVLMHQVLDEAFALDAASSDIGPALDKLTLTIEQSRELLEERAAGEDIASGPGRSS